MRCFDGSEQQRRDPHTSRAQRARRRCAIVHLKPRVVWTWRFSKSATGFVTSRSESRPKPPQHGYHSIVTPWRVKNLLKAGGSPARAPERKLRAATTREIDLARLTARLEPYGRFCTRRVLAAMLILRSIWFRWQLQQEIASSLVLLIARADCVSCRLRKRACHLRACFGLVVHSRSRYFVWLHTISCGLRIWLR